MRPIAALGTIRPMKHYAVAELEITDPSWVPAYVQATTRLVESTAGATWRAPRA